MDIIQKLSIVGLMTLIVYFIMVNILDRVNSKKHMMPTGGNIKSYLPSGVPEGEPNRDRDEEEARRHPMPNQGIIDTFNGEQIGQTDQVNMTDKGAHMEQIGQTEQTDSPYISNRVSTDMTDKGAAACKGTAIDIQSPYGVDNVTTLAIYDPNLKGVAPSNQDLYEKKVDFGSEITNISQFYCNNPEIFQKTMTYVPDVTKWNDMGKQMYDDQMYRKHQGPITASNFEHTLGTQLL
jgi:hypothetical protein